MRLLLVALVAVPLTASPAFAQAKRDSTARDTTTTRPASRDSTAHRPAPDRGVVPADSLPSGDARNVLRSIDEPLSPDEQVAPPDSLMPPPNIAEPDTAMADTSGVPIPIETTPLGEVPGGSAPSVFSDSLASAAPGSGAEAPASGAAPGRPAGTVPAEAQPDTCWRLQLAAPTDREEAAAKRAAAESQLMVGFVIEIEQGRHKVRGRDCVSRAAADALRGRALLSGFADAFLVRMGPDGKAISAAPPVKAGSAKKPATSRRSTSGTRR